MFVFKMKQILIKKHNGLLIQVNRPGQNNNDNHISETGIDNIKNYDILIQNSGSTFDLYEKIRLLSQVSNEAMIFAVMNATFTIA